MKGFFVPVHDIDNIMLIHPLGITQLVISPESIRVQRIKPERNP